MQLSKAEWRVMNSVWGRSAATARDVLEELEEETAWAYTTVKTILSRLADKGVLEVRKRANTSVYTPLLSRSAARRCAVHALMDRAFDGAFGPLMSFLIDDEKLSPEDRRRASAPASRGT